MSQYGYKNVDKEMIYDAVRDYIRGRKEQTTDEIIPEVLNAVADGMRIALEERPR